MSELKKCPFCGESKDGTEVVEHEGWKKLACGYCGAMSPGGNCIHDIEENWQSRPLEDALQARIESMQDDIGIMAVDLNDANNTIADLESLLRWIPVSEKPKGGEAYFIAFLNGEAYDWSYYVDGKWTKLNDDDQKLVTHYKDFNRLPNPPELPTPELKGDRNE
jgi:ribosomal protein S27AE